MFFLLQTYKYLFGFTLKVSPNTADLHHLTHPLVLLPNARRYTFFKRLVVAFGRKIMSKVIEVSPLVYAVWSEENDIDWAIFHLLHVFQKLHECFLNGDAD